MASTTFCSSRITRRRLLAGAGALAASVGVGSRDAAAAAGGGLVAVSPAEDPEAVLHNPDMGWVVYENYPLDQGGGSTLISVPDEEFAPADAVAVMFSWYDVEKQEGEYDFSKVDFAYDHWRKRGRAIHLRMSTESLLWWSRRNPPAGKGIPDTVLARLPEERKQTRECEGIPYTVVDAREPYYLERLERFLHAAAEHFSGDRAVSLVDLRGFGLWGEWHSGYRYPTPEERHAALSGIIDRWAAAFPDNWLALSYSYDPDSPKEYYAGPTHRYDAASTAHYQEFLRYSAFDHALARRNVTFRRDGAGGAVHSNERRLCEEAFATLTKGPFMCEFVGGYRAATKGGREWVAHMVRDALSLHPNYVNLLGWQCADARDFIRERPDLVAEGLRTMGYRLVPVSVRHPAGVRAGAPFRLEMEWVNRGVGRAMRDYHLVAALAGGDGQVVGSVDAGALPTSRWIRGRETGDGGPAYAVGRDVRWGKVPAGEYELRLGLKDPATGRMIALPLRDGRPDGLYRISRVRVE